MRMKMKKVNCKSDFKLIESGCDFTAEFELEYNTGCGVPFRALHKGGIYENCRLMDDGRLMVVFDNHGLGPGPLICERHFRLTDSDCIDGTCDLWDRRQTGVVLTHSRTDACEAEVKLPPYYQKGDKGDAMTWETMDDGAKQELKESVNEALAGEMVVAEPLDENEYEDLF